MPRSESSVLIHLAKGLEELLLAGSEAASDVRRRLEREASLGGTPAGVAQGLAAILDRLEGPGLETLRGVLRAEINRWSELADDDPAAARVQAVFDELLQVLEPDLQAKSDETSATRPRAAPLRSSRRNTV